MRIRLAIPDHLVTPEALEAALEATMLANEQAIHRGEVPPLTDAIASGVRWKPEPFTDGEHFDLAEPVVRRGWGDCDDLAPWLAGELRASGEDPNARPRVYQTGPNRWHVVVETGDGEILDPSVWAGMRKAGRVSGYDDGTGICGMIAKPFARPGDGALAVIPHRGQFWARADIPYPGSHTHIASHARSSDPERAIERAISGAIVCGEGLGMNVERMRVAGTIMLGGTDQLVEIGVLPALAALAPSGGSLAKGLFKGAAKGVKNLFGGKKDPCWPKGVHPFEFAKASKAQKAKWIQEMQACKKARAAAARGGSQHPDGSVSVPLEAERGDGGQHMILTYHPIHAPGPVVMRF